VVNRQAISTGLGLILAVVLNATAQVRVGENVSMNLNGQVSAGYTGDYGNQISSDHGITFGGNADLTGFYYDPNFLSFNVNPFYNQSRLNSTYASNSNASGVNASAAIFSGSHFPGTVSFSELWNSDGTIGLPGIANYTTHGNSDTFGIGWGAYLPNLPSLSVGYQQGGNNYSIYGDNSNGSSGFRNFTLNSRYQVDGWLLDGGYQHSSSHSEFPQFLGAEDLGKSTADGSSFSASVAHSLPLDGSVTVNYNRSSFDSNFGDAATGGKSQYNGTADTVTSSVYFHPVDRLTVGTNAIYTDNLFGSLFQTVVIAGGLVPVNTPGQSANSLDLTSYATYQISRHWNFFGSAEYRDQNNLTPLLSTSGTVASTEKTSLSSESFTGTATYTGDFKGGVVSALLGVQENTINTFNNGSTIGLISSGNYSRAFGSWAFAGGVNYSQNTQTVLIGYTTSNMGYSANMLHKFGRWRWGATAGGSKSLLNSTNYSTFAQNYSTSLSGRWIGVTGAYARSSGNALLASTGLVTNPLPPVLLPTQLVFYGGEGWSIGLGSNPTGRLAITASYSKSQSNTSGTLTPFSFNHNETINARIQYQVRQLYFNAGYTYLLQGFSSSTGPAASFGSYYVGIQRFFNFF
jgi:hypothetical protein